MSHIFLDTRDGRLALYLNGELQFDRRDERLYHEPLALAPAALAARRAPGRPLRVLILGGGDGLALREVLRLPEVAEAHVVDRDPEVLRLGARELAELNGGAFRDPRARAHAADARDFLGRAREFDVLICDLTFPRDVAGAGLLNVPFFRRARAALRPGGVLAVNAVSPELTPQAFGCIGATLGAAGLWAVPYAFALPSFQAEGYGRWGFLFASSRPIRDGELRGLRFPGGAGLTPGAFLAGTSLPAGAERAMAGAPNRRDELLYYLYNAAPLAWEGPLRPLRFGPSRSRLVPGPRPTAAHGFARWLREPEGRRSLDELLACLPLSQRGQTRDAVLEWSRHAEALVRAVDLGAFIEQAMRRARELPRGWVREMRALRDRIRDGLPTVGELLEDAYRVFAILLLVLLLANLFFPDNLYAKGFTSSSGAHASGGASGHGLSFSSPGTRYGAFRSRSGYTGGHFYYYGPSESSGRVYDAEGREYIQQRFAFTDAQGGRHPVSALLALSRDFQLLDSGAVAYAAPVAGHRFLLEPGRLRVLDAAGRDVLALFPGAGLEGEVKRQVRAQGPLIEKAIADHQRWMDWVRWGTVTTGGQHATSELAALEAMQQAVASARGRWDGAAPRPGADPGKGWFAIFPGVYLEPPKLPPATRAVALVTPEGIIRARPVGPPAVLTEEDRFLFWVLNRRLTEGRDASLKDPIARWAEAHGAALGLRPAPPAPTGGRS